MKENLIHINYGMRRQRHGPWLAYATYGVNVFFLVVACNLDNSNLCKLMDKQLGIWCPCSQVGFMYGDLYVISGCERAFSPRFYLAWPERKSEHLLANDN